MDVSMYNDLCSVLCIEIVANVVSPGAVNTHCIYMYMYL